MIENMKHQTKLLVIVDVINGFVHDGALADPDTAHIIPKIEQLAQTFIKEGQPIVAFRDCHTPDSVEFESFPPHCVIGTGQEELVPELKALEHHFIVMDKNATSGFVLPEFMALINDMPNLKEVVIVGLCTDICVLNLAIPLKNHYNQYDLMVDVIAPIALCDTFHIEGHHDRDEWNRMAHRFMEQAGVSVPQNYKPQ